MYNCCFRNIFHETRKSNWLISGASLVETCIAVASVDPLTADGLRMQTHHWRPKVEDCSYSLTHRLRYVIEILIATQFRTERRLTIVGRPLTRLNSQPHEMVLVVASWDEFFSRRTFHELGAR